MTPPPARRTPPRPSTAPSTRPARSRLTITIGDPADCYEVNTLVLKDGIAASPGDTEIRFHVGRTVLALPQRVHVGPQFLKCLRGAAGPSWKWEVASVEPAARKGPPPARRPS